MVVFICNVMSCNVVEACQYFGELLPPSSKQKNKEGEEKQSRI
jgi:hypothetical protein